MLINTFPTESKDWGVKLYNVVAYLQHVSEPAENNQSVKYTYRMLLAIQ